MKGICISPLLGHWILQVRSSHFDPTKLPAMDPVVADRMTDELVGQTVGGWMIEKLLGNGKSAVVFRAYKDQQVAALKIFDPDLVERYGESTQLSRINREKMLIGKRHPNLVEIFDGGKCPTTGYLFVAMQLIEALDLEKVLQDVPRDCIRLLISQLANAAKYLEDMDLVHRDIKPANIAVSSDFQSLTLLDLGVIRPVGDGTLTDNERRYFVGTHQYSPPEFMKRQEVDSTQGWRAVTFYQIGGVLHDLLTKKPLFADYLTPQAVLIQAVEEISPQITGDDLDVGLVQLAKRCLVKNPTIRAEVVTWHDFSVSTPVVSVASMREQARRALAVNHALPAGIAAVATHANVRLLELVEIIQDMIRREAIQNKDLFPPVEVHGNLDRSKDLAEFQIVFPSSTACGLPNALALTFQVGLLDTSAEVVRIAVGAEIGTSVPHLIEKRNPEITTVFTNAFEESAVKECIQSILYSALNTARFHSCVDGSVVEPLKIELQSHQE